MVDYSRYPISQEGYTQNTGRLLAHRLGRQFAEQGYKTWICKGQNKGIDLKVLDGDGDEIIVAEVLNWSPRTNLSETRKRKIIRNLLGYDCHRVLIYTAMGNENKLDELRLHNICTLKIGYQVLPRFFYSHFEAQNKVIGRRIDSRETTLSYQRKDFRVLTIAKVTTLVILNEQTSNNL